MLELSTLAQIVMWAAFGITVFLFVRGAGPSNVVTPVVAVVVVLSFLSLPWVDLSPVKYVIGGNTSVIPQLDDFARDVLKVVFNNSGLAVSILELIGRIANLTGLAVLPLLLFTERGAAIVVLAVPIFAIISGLAGLLSFIPGLENLRRKLGWAQCAFLGLLAIVFLTQLPTIGGAGVAGIPALRLLTVALDGHLGPGAWVAWWGTVLLSVAGFLEGVGRYGGDSIEPSSDGGLE